MNKTISQLLHHEWVGPTPTHDDSFIQQNLYRLYHTIVADLDIEDVRFLINQEILLDDMMPIALGYLRMNILAEGDFYEGDLLNAVLSVSNIFWENHLELKMSLKNIKTLLTRISALLNHLTFQEKLLEIPKTFCLIRNA